MLNLRKKMYRQYSWRASFCVERLFNYCPDGIFTADDILRKTIEG